MNLFGLSPGELLLIMMVAMVVLGPEKLPEVAASLGKWIREFRRATEELTAQFADNNPIYELQRAFSLADDPVPVAPVEEAPPAVVPDEPASGVQVSAAASASAPLLSAPIQSDYFNFPQMYPSVSDLWVHGGLPDIARRNGHATLDIRPIAEEWTFGVPVLPPAPTVEAESPPEAEAVTTSPEDAIVSEAVELAAEPIAEETTSVPETDPDVVLSSDVSADSPTPTDDASAPVEEIPPIRHVAESDLVFHNGVAPHPSEEATAIPVPAGAGDGREGEHP